MDKLQLLESTKHQTVCMKYKTGPYLSALSKDNPVKSKKLRYSEATIWLNSLLQKRGTLSFCIKIRQAGIRKPTCSLHSLLSQVTCHITPFEALQVEQSLSQSLGSFCVGTATVGEGIRAAPLQGLQAAQFRVRVTQAICKIGITAATKKMATLDLRHSRFSRITPER